MSEITLEKIDIIRERANISYTGAKDALVACNGDIVETLIYLENQFEASRRSRTNEFYTTKEEFKSWLKDTIRKGNVSRIKIKHSDDNKVIVDVPVNAGIAAGLFAMIWPPILAIGIVTAVVTKVTIEITKNDGSVEVVNKVIKNALKDINDKVEDIKGELKEKNKKEEINCDEHIEFTVKHEKNDEEK